MTYPETAGHPDWTLFQPIEVRVLWTTPIQSWSEVSTVASNQLIDAAVALGAEVIVFERTVIEEEERATSVVSRAIALGGGSPRLIQELERSESALRLSPA